MINWRKYFKKFNSLIKCGLANSFKKPSYRTCFESCWNDLFREPFFLLKEIDRWTFISNDKEILTTWRKSTKKALLTNSILLSSADYRFIPHTHISMLLSIRNHQLIFIIKLSRCNSHKCLLHIVTNNNDWWWICWNFLSCLSSLILLIKTILQEERHFEQKITILWSPIRSFAEF